MADVISIRFNPKEKAKAVLLKADSLWDKIPTEVKVLFYVPFAGMLLMLSEDILNADINNKYLFVCAVAVANALTVLSKRLSKKVIKFDDIKAKK